MKINVITVDTKLTGGTRVVMELINGLAERGHEVNLVTFGKKKNLTWIDLRANVIEVARTSFEQIAGYLYRKTFGFQPFPEEETHLLMRALPPADINLATLSYTGFAVHRNPTGKAFQLHMHYEPLVREESYKKRIMEESYNLPIAKIANSTWLKHTIKEKTGDDVSGLVFPAIDHKVFYVREEKQPIDKTKKIKIVSLAKYKWWKGFPDALKAIDIVRKKGYDIDFLAFGGAFDPATLPDDLKNIPFMLVGSKMNDALAEFYTDADILISSSFFESFPLPQIEAMACGTPVVTTQYGTEDYAIDGETALVVEPKKPELMAEAILRLIEDGELYKKLSKAGPIMAKKFTWEAAAEEVERIFNAELKKDK
jgi:glycosyltransferase involved in cell wall biosynthesis